MGRAPCQQEPLSSISVSPAQAWVCSRGPTLSNYSCMAYIERLGCTTQGTSGESLSLSGLSFWICKVGF